MKKITIMITAFAVIASFLMLSTAFVQPITAQTTMKIQTTEEEQIGDYLQSLVNDQTFRNMIKEIDMVYKNNDQLKHAYLKSMIKSLEEKEDYIKFTNKLEETYSQLYNTINNKDQVNTDSLPDHIESNLKINDYYSFTFQKPKGTIKSKNIHSFPLINQIIKSNSFLQNLFDKLFNQQNTKTTNDDDDNNIQLYDKVENKIKLLYEAPIHKINGFLIFLETLTQDVYDEIYPGSTGSDQIPIEDQCRGLSLALELKNDPTIQQQIKVIAEEENIENILQQLNEEKDRNKRDAILNQLTENIENNEKYQALYSKISDTFDQESLSKLLSPAGIFLFILAEAIASVDLIIGVSLFIISGFIGGIDALIYTGIPIILYLGFGMIFFVGGFLCLLL
jgi:hypothetical protein